MSLNEPHVPLNEPVGDTVKTTTCYMCACRCGIKVHLKDGKRPLHRGQSGPPGEQGRAVRQGLSRHHAALFARPPDGAAEARRPARLRRIQGNLLGRSARDGGRLARRQSATKDPSKLAFFTGRDQSQALTGWFAQQFGTPNFAAHGGFCSVNMAAAGLYTFGGSFWEFGEPDWDHTKYFLLFGVAEDHASNPIKTALGKLKARGAKVVAINPVRTGYGAIADEWIGMRPGTDGMFVGALIHELLAAQKVDLDSLARYTNASWLVIDAPGAADDGLFARNDDGNPLCLDSKSGERPRCHRPEHPPGR